MLSRDSTRCRCRILCYHSPNSLTCSCPRFLFPCHNSHYSTFSRTLPFSASLKKTISTVLAYVERSRHDAIPCLCGASHLEGICYDTAAPYGYSARSTYRSGVYFIFLIIFASVVIRITLIILTMIIAQSVRVPHLGDRLSQGN